MAFIDFKEIPAANSSNGDQDRFELFAREFFIALGFRIVDGPDRGPDGGRDLILEEERSGGLGCIKLRWLISCKHFAHSGKAVCENNEINIVDRLTKFNCYGLIGFYSTIVSSGLNDTFEGLKDRYEIKIFDGEIIERELLGCPKRDVLLMRFFPESYKRLHEKDKRVPEKIYSKYEPLKCEWCGKDLLNNHKNGYGVFVYVKDLDSFMDMNVPDKIVDVYCACKGDCDRALEREYPTNCFTVWKDMSFLTIPLYFLHEFVDFIHDLRFERIDCSDGTYKKIITVFLKLAQLTMKSSTDEELKRINMIIP